ncbi:MAG: hypothetical protein JO321_15215 [Solirubrobacterales bacterium]|nr:hypothetical protein [Solirubrobacterales bacterium]MBV9536752.1 hypothetical protein [Solirubrobacterales bacterium]
MSGEYQLVLMIAAMHLLGLVGVAVLLYIALRHDSGYDRRPGESGDDGWGNEPRRPPEPSGRPWGGVPLPDAEQARLRVRDHRKLPDLLPGRERRPAREPAPVPHRTPVGT